MEDMPLLSIFVEKRDYITKIHLKDAYFYEHTKLFRLM